MKNINKAIYLNGSLSIYLSCVNVGLNIMTQLEEQNGYKNLGSISLFLVYFFSTIGNVVSPTYITRFRYNSMFFLHAMGYLFFLSEGVLVCYCGSNKELNSIFCSTGLIWFLVIVGSSMTGFLAAGFWVCQNQYTSELSTDSDRGVLFGISWALVSSSQLIGPLISTFIIERLGQLMFFITILSVATLATILFLMVQQPIQEYQQVNLKLQEEEVEIIQSHISTQEQLDFNKLPIKVQLKEIKEVFLSEKLRYLLLPIFMTGLQQSFQQTFLYVLIQGSIDDTQSDELVNKLTLNVMLSLGAAEIFGGLTISLLNNRLSKSKIILLLNQIIQLALIIALVNVYLRNYSFCFFIAGLFGFVDCGNSSAILALLSGEFSQDIRVFGMYNFVQCWGGCFGSVCSLIFRKFPPLYLLIVVQCISALSNLYIHAWTRKYKGKQF